MYSLSDRMALSHPCHSDHPWVVGQGQRLYICYVFHLLRNDSFMIDTIMHLRTLLEVNTSWQWLKECHSKENIWPQSCWLPTLVLTNDLMYNLEKKKNEVAESIVEGVVKDWVPLLWVSLHLEKLDSHI